MPTAVFYLLILGICACVRVDAQSTTVAPDTSLHLNQYIVNYTTSNQSCLMMKARIQLQLRYATINNSLSDWIKVNVTQAAYADPVRSMCLSPNPMSPMVRPANNSNFEILAIDFDTGWTLTLAFSNDTQITTRKAGEYFSLFYVRLVANLRSHPTTFPGPKNNTVTHAGNITNDQNGFLTSVMASSSLFCKSGFINAVDSNLKIKITNIQLQAFQRLDPGSNYVTPYQLCPADERSSDLIPIIVGGCLAGLVLVVTIGYLIGSARKKPSKVEVDVNGYADGKQINETVDHAPSEENNTMKL